MTLVNSWDIMTVGKEKDSDLASRWMRSSRDIILYLEQCVLCICTYIHTYILSKETARVRLSRVGRAESQGPVGREDMYRALRSVSLDANDV